MGPLLGAFAFFAVLYSLWRLAQPSVRLLDDPGLASGSQPTPVPGPASPLYVGDTVSVGNGWMATRHGNGWCVLTAADVSLVGVVPPSQAWQLLFSRAWLAQGPYLVFRTMTGRYIRFDCHRLDTASRAALAGQLTQDTTVTAVARTFLTTGALPGRWAGHWQFGGFRFGAVHESVR